MDPFSQAALGAVVAQTASHRELGLRVTLLGAAAGAFPDIDVLFSLTGDFVDQLVTHRGITHSLFFAPVVGPLFGWLIWRIERRTNPDITTTRRSAERRSAERRSAERRNHWMWAMSLALLSHPLLDLLTPYGTQLLQPFSDARFAINAMPIIDPVYTLLLLTGLLASPAIARKFARTHAGLRSYAGLRSQSGIAGFTLVLSSGYLGYGWALNTEAEHAAREQLAASGYPTARVAAFPTILQIHYRRVVARLEDRDMVGFYSAWAPCEIEWQSAPRGDTRRLDGYLATREGRVFEWFAMGWTHHAFTALADGGLGLRVSDLRYGFDGNPADSVFSLVTELGHDGSVRAPISAGQNLPRDTGSSIGNLFAATYAPACRFLQ